MQGGSRTTLIGKDLIKKNKCSTIWLNYLRISLIKVKLYIYLKIKFLIKNQKCLNKLIMKDISERSRD